MCYCSSLRDLPHKRSRHTNFVAKISLASNKHILDWNIYCTEAFNISKVIKHIRIACARVQCAHDPMLICHTNCNKFVHCLK